ARCRRAVDEAIRRQPRRAAPAVGARARRRAGSGGGTCARAGAGASGCAEAGVWAPPRCRGALAHRDRLVPARAGNRWKGLLEPLLVLYPAVYTVEQGAGEWTTG